MAQQAAPNTVMAKAMDIREDWQDREEKKLQAPALDQVISSGDEIIDLVASHLVEKFKDGSVQLARKMKGGREVWLQIELTMVLIKHLTTMGEGIDQYFVEREKTVLVSNGTGNQEGKGNCDIWLLPKIQAHGPRETGYVIELEVAYDGAAKSLHDRFLSDMVKLHSGLNSAALAQSGGISVKRLCLGVTGDPADLNRPFSNPDTRAWDKATWEKQEIRYTWLKENWKFLLNGQPQAGLAILWWLPDSGVV